MKNFKLGDTRFAWTDSKLEAEDITDMMLNDKGFQELLTKYVHSQDSVKGELELDIQLLIETMQERLRESEEVLDERA